MNRLPDSTRNTLVRQSLKADGRRFSQEPVTGFGGLSSIADCVEYLCDPRTARLSQERERELAEVEATERGADAYNDIRFAIIGHFGDSRAMVPTYTVDAKNVFREKSIPIIEAYSQVCEDAPVVEALRNLRTNPNAETADAFERAFAERFAADNCEGLSLARIEN